MPLTASQCRVLVVDDIQPMRMLMRQMLRKLGITNVVQAIDGSDALVKMMDEPVDLIISDWNMAPMSGMDLLRTIRGEAAFKHIPFIMITGHVAIEEVALARKAGVNGYLAKPFGLDLLKKQIGRFVDVQLVA